MPIYNFQAKKLSGEEVFNKKEAQNPAELAKFLKEEGFVLISCFEAEKEKKFLAIPRLFGVSMVEKMNFARNLAVMIGAGVSLLKGIETLSRQTSDKKFKDVLTNLIENIQKGQPLHKAMEAHPDVFPNIFIAMVKAGEISGKLEESLNLIAVQLEKDYELKKRVRGALLYPIVIIIAMVAIAVLMMIYVVPTLSSTFKELNIQLPLSTRIIIGTSDFISNNILLFLLAIGGAISGFWFFLQSSFGKKIIDTALLKIPVVADITIKINASRTSRTLSSLITAGVDILEALKITADVLQNHYYKIALEEAQSQIQKGKLLSGIFIKHQNLYPVIVGEMTAVGEETGKLPEMLLRIADFYESDVASKTKDLSIIIEPILMLIIGAVVGFFAVSMIQPIYNMAGSI